MENKTCLKCGGTATHKEGISKTGKPYSMFKCGGCGDIEWLPTVRPKSAPQGVYKAKAEGEQGEKIIEGLRQIYAVLVEIRDQL